MPLPSKIGVRRTYRDAVLQRLAGWCYDRRRRVLGAWIAGLVVFSVLGQVAGGSLLKTFSLSGTDASDAFTILGRDFQMKGDTGQLVWAVKGSGVDPTSPEVQQTLQPVLDEIAKQPHVVSVTSPFNAPDQQSRLVSGDKPIAFAEIQFDIGANDVAPDEAAHMRDLVAKVNSPQLQVELGGPMFTDQTQPASEFIGVLAAVVILLIAFGSVLAMGLPILTALVGIGIGLAIVEILAHVLDVPDVRARGHRDDRHRRRHRLRAVHRHPVPQRAPRRTSNREPPS